MSTTPPAPPAQPMATGPRTNVLAIVSLITAILGFSIVGVILGHISLGQIKKTGEAGHGLALAGTIIGYVGCALWIIFWIVYIAILVTAGSVYSYYGLF